MSSIATLNGVQYIIPAYNDTGWAQGTGNLSQYLAAIASATLQPTGGSFTLTADVDFGSNFGLKALFLKTETANPASAGVIRLASTDTIKWRNNANGADIALSKDTSDNLQWNATKLLLSGAVVNADINASAAIAYTKLALTGTILNADISASAAIALNKLAAVTASRALVSDASGFVSASTVTAATLAFLDATSSVQTQINSVVTTANAALPKAGGTMTGNIAFTTTSSQGVVGTTTNDSAATGNVGQYLEAVSSGNANVPGASNAWGDVISLSLPAGDYMITASTCVNLSGATGAAFVDYGISSTSGNSSTGLVFGQNYFEVPISSASDSTLIIPPYRVSIASTTTYYLKLNMPYATTSPVTQGRRISAWRVR